MAGSRQLRGGEPLRRGPFEHPAYPARAMAGSPETLDNETVIRAVIDVMNAEGLALYTTQRGVQWFDRRHFGSLLTKAIRAALSEYEARLQPEAQPAGAPEPPCGVCGEPRHHDDCLHCDADHARGEHP